MNKQNLIKLKSFWTAKEIFNKTKRQSIEQEETLANDQQEINIQNIQIAYTTQKKKPKQPD